MRSKRGTLRQSIICLHYSTVGTGLVQKALFRQLATYSASVMHYSTVGTQRAMFRQRTRCAPTIIHSLPLFHCRNRSCPKGFVPTVGNLPICQLFTNYVTNLCFSSSPLGASARVCHLPNNYITNLSFSSSPLGANLCFSSSMLHACYKHNLAQFT